MGTPKFNRITFALTALDCIKFNVGYPKSDG